MPRPRAALLTKTCARTECGQEFVTPDRVHFREKRYCTRTCANRDTTEAREQTRGVGSLGYTPPQCPCGAEIPPSPGQAYVYSDNKKYCSVACRKKYGKKRQADPTNYITFDCETCGESTTRRKSTGNANRFCSNICAAKHTKVVRHYVIRDLDMVLDSGWEVLFAGLCFYLKISVERVDRSLVVEWVPGRHYAPDFVLPVLGPSIWVEVKGLQDPEDRERWAAWREQRGLLAVLGRDELDDLRCIPDADRMVRYLRLRADNR